jgi:hypothetical protein
VLKKSFLTDERNCSGPLMRFARGDVRDDIVSHKNDHGPVAIRFDLGDKDRSLLAAMAAEIGLTVSVEIKPAYPATTLDGIFPDRGAHGASFPHDIARKADIMYMG